MTIAAQSAIAKHVSFERERGVYQVVVTPSLAHVHVMIPGEANRNERIQRIFECFAQAGLPIFFIKLHRLAISFALEGSRIDQAEKILQQLDLVFKLRQNLALITIRASSMRDLTGIMVTIADALQAANARLYGLSDSHTSVLCLIAGDRAIAALNQLKKTFELEDERG